jgi:hypothetical protein
MILALLLLLVAPGRLTLVDETIEVPAQSWQAIDIELRQRPALIECRYLVEGDGPDVRLALMRPADVERFRDGIRHHVLAATEYGVTGALRFGPGPTGEYNVVVDNRLDGRVPARVHLTVSLVFPRPRHVARELSPQRRLWIILLSAVYVAALAFFVVRKWDAFRRGKP